MASPKRKVQIAIGDTVVRRTRSKGLAKGGPTVSVGTRGTVIEYSNEQWWVRWENVGVIGIPEADIRCRKHRRNMFRVCNGDCDG